MSRAGSSSTPQAQSHLIKDRPNFAIGGAIWQEVHSDEGVQRLPWPKVSVQIKDTGLFTETDEQGRYRFYRLQPGQYTLIVRQKARPPHLGALLKEETITVAWPPSYDVAIPVVDSAAEVPNTVISSPSAEVAPAQPSVQETAVEPTSTQPITPAEVATEFTSTDRQPSEPAVETIVDLSAATAVVDEPTLARTPAETIVETAAETIPTARADAEASTEESSAEVETTTEAKPTARKRTTKAKRANSRNTP